MKLLRVKMIGNPHVIIRNNLPYQEVGDKNKKPFRATVKAWLLITYEDKSGEHSIGLSYTPPYNYDGATIPFGLGKGNMKYPTPALWHDLMCENKSKFTHKLASLVFKELLIQCGVNKFQAQIMYFAVENWQRLLKGWKNDG